MSTLIRGLIDPTVPLKEQTVSTEDAADLLGMSANHVRKLIATGAIASIRPTHGIRIPKREIERILAESFGFPARLPDEPNEHQLVPDGVGEGREEAVDDTA